MSLGPLGPSCKQTRVMIKHRSAIKDSVAPDQPVNLCSIFESGALLPTTTWPGVFLIHQLTV